MCFTDHPFLIIYFIPATISADSRHFVWTKHTRSVSEPGWRQSAALWCLQVKTGTATEQAVTVRWNTIPSARHPPPAARDGFRPKDVFTTLWIKLTASITSEEILVSKNEWNKFIQEGNEMNSNLPPLTMRSSSKAKTRIHPEDGERNLHRNIRTHDAVKLRNSKQLTGT